MSSINFSSSKQVFKNPAIDFSALFNPLGNSTCSSPEVVLAFLLYEGERPIRLLCLLFLCRLRFSSIPTDKNLKSVLANFKLQTAVSPHPLKIGHMFIWTYLLGIVDTATS